MSNTKSLNTFHSSKSYLKFVSSLSMAILKLSTVFELFVSNLRLFHILTVRKINEFLRIKVEHLVMKILKLSPRVNVTGEYPKNNV